MASNAPGAESRSLTAIAVCILTTAVGLAYANTLSAPFEFDDFEAILNNPTLRHLSALRSVFGPPHELGSTVGGRPILNLSFACNYAVSGTAVGSYHLVNIAIHLGCALLLFGILRRILRFLPAVSAHPVSPAPTSPDLTALAIATLWALHPLQTEAVTYLSQRAESLASFFYLLTVYAFVRGAARYDAGGRAPASGSGATDDGARSAMPEDCARRGVPWLAVSVLACLAGVATKEIVATAPVLLLLLDRTLIAGSFRRALRTRWAWYLALASSWLLVGTLVASTHDRGGTAGFDTGVTVWSYLLTQAQAITLYLKLVVWPNPLVFDYGTHLASGLTKVWPEGALVVALLVTGVAALCWREPAHRARRAVPGGSSLGSERTTRPAGSIAAGFALVSFFVLLAPSSSVVPIGSQTMAEHRMYLPLAALVTLGLTAAVRCFGQRALIGSAALALVGGGLTWHRNAIYRTDVSLWADTAAHVPGNARAHNNLGNALVTGGQFADALSEYQKAVRLQPDYTDAHSNLGHVLVKLGRPREALEHEEFAIQRAPNSVAVLTNYGLALSRSGRVPEAIAAFQKAVRLSPTSIEARYDLGNAYYQTGDFKAAIAEYEQVLQQHPAQIDARFNFAYALLQLNRPQEALDQFETVLRYDPKLADGHVEAGNLLAHFGRLEDAVVHFETALQLKPDLAVAQEQLDQARRRLRLKQP